MGAKGVQFQDEWKELQECPVASRKETKTEIKLLTTEGKKKREKKLQVAHVEIFFIENPNNEGRWIIL